MKRRFLNVSVLTALLVMTASFSGNGEAQDKSKGVTTVAGDANACELNAALLDNLIVMARESNERVFVIARLGKGETSRYLIHRRLYNARIYLDGRLKPEAVVLAEGERTNEQGRVEFYLGSKLIINSLVARGGDLCVNCCEGLEHYYGWGKKDSLKRQRQLMNLTPHAAATSRHSR
ncbi:hypothetical protein BH18ACI2_BH18ACI2_12120 [soil metagenome]